MPQMPPSYDPYPSYDSDDPLKSEDLDYLFEQEFDAEPSFKDRMASCGALLLLSFFSLLIAIFITVAYFSSPQPLTSTSSDVVPDESFVQLQIASLYDVLCKNETGQPVFVLTINNPPSVQYLHIDGYLYSLSLNVMESGRVVEPNRLTYKGCN